MLHNVYNTIVKGIQINLSLSCASSKHVWTCLPFLICSMYLRWSMFIYDKSLNKICSHKVIVSLQNTWTKPLDSYGLLLSCMNFLKFLVNGGTDISGFIKNIIYNLKNNKLKSYVFGTTMIFGWMISLMFTIFMSFGIWMLPQGISKNIRVECPKTW